MHRNSSSSLAFAVPVLTSPSPLTQMVYLQLPNFNYDVYHVFYNKCTQDFTDALQVCNVSFYSIKCKEQSDGHKVCLQVTFFSRVSYVIR